MKKVMIILGWLAFLWLANPAHAQNNPPIRSGAVLPSTCTPGGIFPAWFLLTSAGPAAVPYYCSATNTWTASGGSSGAPPAGSQFWWQFNNAGGMFGASADFSVDLSSPLIALGTGSISATFGGSYTDYVTNPGAIFLVQVDSNGTPDTFEWNKNGGAFTTLVPMTVCPTTTALSNGVTVCFAASTGNSIGDNSYANMSISSVFGVRSSAFATKANGNTSYPLSQYWFPLPSASRSSPGNSLTTYDIIGLGFLGHPVYREDNVAAGSYATPTAVTDGNYLTYYNVNAYDGVQFDWPYDEFTQVEGPPVGGSGVAGFHGWELYNNAFTVTIAMELHGSTGEWDLTNEGTNIFGLKPVGAGIAECNTGTVGSLCQLNLGVLNLGANVVNPFLQTKNTQTATAPGAGKADMRWLAGTNAGTCKLVANAGTSATEVTIIDNVGGGC